MNMREIPKDFFDLKKMQLLFCLWFNHFYFNLYRRNTHTNKDVTNVITIIIIIKSLLL